LPVAEIETAGEFVAETDVTVGALPERVTVDPDLAVGHHAVKFDEHAARGVIRREGEAFAVPADARREERAGAGRRRLLVERAGDAPIVRHVHDAPRGVGEIGQLRARGVALEETPAGIERLGDATAVGRTRRPGGRRPGGEANAGRQQSDDGAEE
jgi:hypothetical protein